MPSVRLTALALVLTALSMPALAATINVPADQPTIQAGIDAAIPGDEVVVAPGTYEELIDFDGKAITLRSSGGPDVTTIDATSVADPGTGKPVVRIDSGEGADSLLEGFTLTGGTGDTSAFGVQIGGGLYCGVGVSPTIVNCTFSNLTVDTVGGGAFLNEASPTFEGCRFLACSAPDNSGGAIFAFTSGEVTATDCLFEGNVGTSGGAIYAETSLTLTGCDFIGNSASGPEPTGAGVFINHGVLGIHACRFIGNACVGPAAFNSAGGLLVAGPATATITNTVIVGNSAEEGGGAEISSAEASIVNCTIAGNSADDNGGGLRVTFGSDVTIANCILWGNSDAGGMDASAQISSQFGAPTVSDSILQGGWGGPGANNLDADPLLADLDGADDTLGTADDDVRLTAGSPAIDQGSLIPYAAAGAPQTDLDGNPRFFDDPDTPGASSDGVSLIDLGPYEFGSNAPAPTGACCVGGSCAAVDEATCLSFGGAYSGDDTLCSQVICQEPVPAGTCCIDGACATAPMDFCLTFGGTFLGVGAPCVGCFPACEIDTNGDGFIDSQDLNNILGEFGQLCP